MTIKIDDLAAAISQELENYSEETTVRVKAAVDDVAALVMQEIKDHVTFKQPTGNYVKSFRLASVETKHSKTKTWHVAKPYFRLTHLLEKGHVLRNGGRTEAFPHIQYGEDLAKKLLTKKVEEAVQNAGT